ncbi:hypothetical protein GCM10009069_15740 [Algimonas arctica]|uniref:Uncharacterized protein n=1 Tax=Algimonas arctica TaxID=1479486 RepID=A0A8J3G248_9PROT|nr:hypothetical protein [Algimonas arctica]GHA93515.1 hypothetical protein GCM10009069_15740 [Algimonas arctica]
MKAVFGAIVNTIFLVAILAPVCMTIIWLLMSGLHAPKPILYSGEALMLIPIAIFTRLLFKSALKIERELKGDTAL